jgi:hypothetical protein
MAPLAALPRASAAQLGRGDSSPDAKDDGCPEDGGGRGSKIIKIVSYDHGSDSDFL